MGTNTYTQHDFEGGPKNNLYLQSIVYLLKEKGERLCSTVGGVGVPSIICSKEKVTNIVKIMNVCSQDGYKSKGLTLS